VKRYSAAATVAAALIVLAFHFAAGASAAGSLTPSLSIDTQQFQYLGIVSALPAAGDVEGASLTYARAVDVAAKFLGRDSVAAVVWHGKVRATYYDIRSTWIVLFPGGNTPVTGPIGYEGLIPPVKVTAVYVDDVTGEVLGGYMQ